MFARSLMLLGALALTSATHAADAPAAPWKAGTDYNLIDPPVTTATPGKVEVTEVFSYGCPTCNFSYPAVDKIAKSLPANAVMTYVPVSFNTAESFPLFQRAFLTAQALGIADKSHDAMFDAVWKTKELTTMNDDGRTLKKPPPSIEDVAKFYTKFGIKAEDFIATANSFSVNTKMKQADAFVKATEVSGTPAVVVAGKYRIDNPSRDWDKAGQLIRYLVQLESSAK